MGTRIKYIYCVDCTVVEDLFYTKLSESLSGQDIVVSYEVDFSSSLHHKFAKWELGKEVINSS